jgi:hypothetical protein
MSIGPKKQGASKPSSRPARTVAICAEHLSTLYIQLFGVNHDFVSRFCNLAINLDQSTVTPFPTKLQVE